MYSACPRFLCSEMYQWSQGIGAGWKNDIGELGPRDYWRKKLPLAVIFSLHRWAQTSQKLIFTLSRCTSMEGGGQRWLRKRNRIPKIGGRKDMWKKARKEMAIPTPPAPPSEASSEIEIREMCPGKGTGKTKGKPGRNPLLSQQAVSTLVFAKSTEESRLFSGYIFLPFGRSFCGN